MNQKRHDPLDALRTRIDKLSDREKQIARHVAERRHISRNVGQDYVGRRTFGQKMADKVAQFGGSWTFIGLFAFVLLSWIALNSLILADKPFDPYPYILLNLCLSMLAAIQAPIILMSQNRQSHLDRINAEHDYEVNLKAELEIMALHDKVDALREQQWTELMSVQQEQLRLLSELIGELSGSRKTGPNAANAPRESAGA